MQQSSQDKYPDSNESRIRDLEEAIAYLQRDRDSMKEELDKIKNQIKSWPFIGKPVYIDNHN